MPAYLVKCSGYVDETWLVNAESEQAAMAKCFDNGDILYAVTGPDFGPVSVAPVTKTHKTYQPGEMALLDMSGPLLGPPDPENPVWERVTIVSCEGVSACSEGCGHNEPPLVYTVEFDNGMHWEVLGDELTTGEIE